MSNLLREARIILLVSWLYSINFSKHKSCASTFLSDAPPYPKENCVLEDTQASPVCPSGNRNIKMKIITVH